MVDLLDTIKKRRSIRRFNSDPVEKQKVDALLESIRWAPSWANTQCWEIILVEDADIKNRLRDTLPPTNPARKAMVEAPLIFVVCGATQKAGYYKGEVTTKFGDWFMFDLGLATQNLCLMAHSLGLGSVIVGLFDHDKVRDILGIPKDYEVVVMVPIGYPSMDAKPPARRDVNEFVHRDGF